MHTYNSDNNSGLILTKNLPNAVHSSGLYNSCTNCTLTHMYSGGFALPSSVFLLRYCNEAISCFISVSICN